MVNLLREGLAGNVPSRDQFEDLLRAAGYLDTHAARYEQPHYALRKSQFFDVREGFPRLTGKDLPSGVGDLVYTVMVGQCLQFAITESEMNSLILGMA